MRNRAIAWLKENVPPKRLLHVLGVEKLCGELAMIHKIDEEKAKTAGLMHDLAKFFTPSKLLAIAKQDGIEIDKYYQKKPKLLHAEVGAIVARDEFGVKDEEVLNAIRNHTLGSPEMSTLSCIVFVADALEPNRGNSEDRKKLRILSQKNIYKSVKLTCDSSINYLIGEQKTIHPRTILTRNWALNQSKKIKEA